MARAAKLFFDPFLVAQLFEQVFPVFHVLSSHWFVVNGHSFTKAHSREHSPLSRHPPRSGNVSGRLLAQITPAADNTIVGGRPQGRLTRIAGRDVTQPDGHTVGKTFSRKGFLDCPWQHSPARSAASASNPLPTPSPDLPQRLDPSGPLRHKSACPQNGARETGLGHWLPGFLCSNDSSQLNFHRLAMPNEN